MLLRCRRVHLPLDGAANVWPLGSSAGYLSILSLDSLAEQEKK